MFGKPSSYPPLPADDLEQILHQTSSLWEEARGKRFFITGGTGFFGIWLLESFAYINDAFDLGAEALILTRNVDHFLKRAPHLSTRSDLQFLPGDIRSFSFPSGTFDYIIHAATEVSQTPPTNPEDVLSAIIGGTRRVLDFAVHTKVKKLLFTSSGAVYGIQPPDITHISENFMWATDSQPNSSAYCEGKRESEQLSAAHALQHGYDLKIARCFAFVGPHLPLDSSFAVGNFIGDALAQRPIQIAGDGSPERSYLYASDLASWLWTLLFRSPSQRIYNVGSDDRLSISQLANLVKATVGTPSPVKIAGRSDPTRPILRYVPSVARAQQELGLQITVPLSDAISKTASWLRTASIS